MRDEVVVWTDVTCLDCGIDVGLADSARAVESEISLVRRNHKKQVVVRFNRSFSLHVGRRRGDASAVGSVAPRGLRSPPVTWIPALSGTAGKTDEDNSLRRPQESLRQLEWPNVIGDTDIGACQMWRYVNKLRWEVGYLRLQPVMWVIQLAMVESR